MPKKAEYRDTFDFRLFPDHTYTNAQKRRFRLFQGRIEHWRKAVNYADSFDEPNKINLLYLIGYSDKIRPYVKKTRSNLVVLCAEVPHGFLQAYDDYWSLVESYKGSGYVNKDGIFTETYASQRALENDHRGDGLLPDEIYERNDREAAILAAYAKAGEDAVAIFSSYRVIARSLPEKFISNDDLDWIIRKIFPYGREQTGMGARSYTAIKLVADVLKVGLERIDATKLLRFPDGTDCYAVCKKSIRRCEMNISVSLRKYGYVDLAKIMEQMKYPPYGWDNDPHSAYCFGYAVGGFLDGTWIWDGVSCWKSADVANPILLNILRKCLLMRSNRFVLVQESGNTLSERFAYMFDVGTGQYHPKDNTDKQILSMFLEGMSERKIANEIGTMSNIAIHKRLIRMGKATQESTPFCNMAHKICNKIEGVTSWPIALVDKHLTDTLNGESDCDIESFHITPIFGRQRVHDALSYFTWGKCKELKKKLDRINELVPDLIRQRYGTDVDVEQIKTFCTTRSSGWLWSAETFWECVDHYMDK